jgi:hypothetical protein
MSKSKLHRTRFGSQNSSVPKKPKEKKTQNVNKQINLRTQRSSEAQKRHGLPEILKKRRQGQKLAAKTPKAKQEAADAAQAKGEKIDLYRQYLSETQTKLINVPNKLKGIGKGFTLGDSLTEAFEELNSLPGFETLNLEGLQQRQKVLAGLLDQLKDRVRDFLAEEYIVSPNFVPFELRSIIREELDLPLDLNLNVRTTFTSLAPKS